MELISAQLVLEVHRFCTASHKGTATAGLAEWRSRLIDERLKADGPQAGARRVFGLAIAREGLLRMFAPFSEHKGY